MVMVEEQHWAQNRNANETQQARVGYNPDDEATDLRARRYDKRQAWESIGRDGPNETYFRTNAAADQRPGRL